MAESAEKSANGMPLCIDLKIFEKKCALTTEQILHMVKGKAVSGPQVGYDITTFIFYEDGSVTTNGRTGGKWKAESNLLSIENHWGPKAVRCVVSNEDLNSFGFMSRAGLWFSWK